MEDTTKQPDISFVKTDTPPSEKSNPGVQPQTCTLKHTHPQEVIKDTVRMPEDAMADNSASSPPIGGPHSHHLPTPPLPSQDTESLDGCSNDSGEFHPKLPILRLKKLGGEDFEMMTFEKQETSKNDSYCWVCHDGGDVLCCDNCARVFHVQCSGLPKAPEGEEEWFCPVCKNIAKKTKRSRPPNLKELLLLAVNRMMFPGTEIFQHDVPEDIVSHYQEYIFFPMHLGKIKAKVAAGRYQSTREFLHDTEWILHNCIIYNGAKHALTKISKGIVKVCKEDMREIELCPSCYSLTVNQPKDWFCTPCNPPHRVVLAKVRGYPLWPAKLISETSDKCDVRFFGQHDRSLVPKSCIQELNGPPPTPTTKTQYWNIAMYELQRYRENINAMFEQMGGSAKGSDSGPSPTDRPQKLTKISPKPREPKSMLKMASNQQPDTYDNQGSHVYSRETLSNHQLVASNYVPFSPQLVEVSVNLSETEDSGSIHGNSATFMESMLDSDASSPGSEPELQIDLGVSGFGRAEKRGEKVSPAKSRTAPSGNRYMYKKTAPPPVGGGGFDLGVSPQPHTGVVITSPQVSGNSTALASPKFNNKRKGRKPGETLSALATSLAERKGMGGFQLGLPTPAGTPGETSEAMESESQEDFNSQFSSIYRNRDKTAIAVVDPDNKRIRKRKFRIEPPPKKSARLQSQTKTTTLQANSVESATTSPSLITPMVQDLNHEALMATLRAEIPSIKHVVTSTPNGSPVQNSRPHTQMDTQMDTQTHAQTDTQTHAQTDTQTHAQTHTLSNKTLIKKNRGRPPKTSKSVAARTKESAPTRPATLAPTRPATLAPTAPVSIASTPTPGIDWSPAMTTPTSTFASSTEVRGKAAAPRLVEEESTLFAEGSGLLADTIRKVDRTFRARMNQMGGGSEDLGYQYFSEKLMTSIKTVLIEMLSTFEAKGKMGAKQLKEQLHLGWPVPDSRAALGQLRKDLQDEMRQSLEVVRASAELERQQVVSEVRRQAEAEKEIAVNETKKKKWCSYCWKEAQYNCCWNANYCNELCQQSHWPEHMKNCTQVQQQVPRTPAPLEMAGTPISKIPPNQLPMMQESQGFVYASPQSGGHVIVNQNGNSSAGGGPPSLNLASLPSQHQRFCISHEPGTPLMSMEGLPQLVEQPTLDQSMAPIEHIRNEGVMLNSANPSSPPNHIRTLLLNQQASKSSVIHGSHYIDSTPTLVAISNPTLVCSSDHSSNSGSLVNINSMPSQPPMSPVSPPSVNPPSVPNPNFNWPYQQPVIIGSDSYPLLPVMHTNTPTSQNQVFFKAF